MYIDQIAEFAILVEQTMRIMDGKTKSCYG